MRSSNSTSVWKAASALVFGIPSEKWTRSGLASQWISCGVVLLISALYAQRWWGGRRRLRLPPGPPSFPIVGALPLLKGKPDHQIFADWTRDHGPIVSFKLGMVPAVVVGTAEMAREILKNKDKIFASRPRNLLGKYLGFDYHAMALSPYNAHYVKTKRLYDGTIFAAKNLPRTIRLREREVRKAVSSMLQIAELQEPIKVRSEMMTLSLNIIMGIVIGGAIGGDTFERLKVNIVQSVEMALNLVALEDAFPFMRYLTPLGFGRGVHVQFQKILDAQLHACSEVIHERRRRKLPVTDPDFLDVLLAMDGEEKLSDLEICSALAGIIVPGFDTTYVTVEWVMVELIRHAHIMARAQEELDGVVGRNRLVQSADIKNLPLLHRIITESLRLHPPVPLALPHYSMEDCEISGFFIRAGTTTFINLWSIARDPNHWDEPLEFNPDRFLEQQACDRTPMGTHFELLPFSAGRRGCIGKRTGLDTLELVVATFVHAFDWEALGLKDGSELDMTESRGLSTSRVQELICTIRPRLPSHAYE